MSRSGMAFLLMVQYRSFSNAPGAEISFTTALLRDWAGPARGETLLCGSQHEGSTADAQWVPKAIAEDSLLARDLGLPLNELGPECYFSAGEELRYRAIGFRVLGEFLKGR